MTAVIADEPETPQVTPGLTHLGLFRVLERTGVPAWLLALGCFILMVLSAFVMLILVRAPDPASYRNSVAFCAIVSFFLLFYFRMGRGFYEDFIGMSAFDGSLLPYAKLLSPPKMITRLELAFAFFCAYVNLRWNAPPMEMGDNPGFWASLYFFLALQYIIVIFCVDLLLRQLMVLNRVTENIRIDLWESDFYSLLAEPMLRFFALYVFGLCVITMAFLVFTEGEFGAGEMAVIMMPWYFPGLILMSLFLLPYRRFRQRVHLQKTLEMNRVQEAIKGNPELMKDSPLGVDLERLRLVDLLAYRDRIARVREWPFTDRVRSFVLFGFLPPLTWVLAAFIEILIESNL